MVWAVRPALKHRTPCQDVRHARTQLLGSSTRFTCSREFCLSTSRSTVSPMAHPSSPLYKSELDLRVTMELSCHLVRFHMRSPVMMSLACEVQRPGPTPVTYVITAHAMMSASNTSPHGLVVEFDDDVAQHQAPILVPAGALNASLAQQEQGCESTLRPFTLGN